MSNSAQRTGGASNTPHKDKQHGPAVGQPCDSLPGATLLLKCYLLRPHIPFTPYAYEFPLWHAISTRSVMVTNFWHVLLLLGLCDLIPWGFVSGLTSSSISSANFPDALIFLGSILWIDSFIQPSVPATGLLLLLVSEGSKKLSLNGTKIIIAWLFVYLR
jgi:hypothetical protein